MNMRIHRIALTVVTLGAAMLCAAPAVHATAGLAEWEVATPGGHRISHIDPLKEHYGTCLRRADAQPGVISNTPSEIYVDHLEWWRYYPGHVVGKAAKGFFVFQEATERVDYFTTEGGLSKALAGRKLGKPSSERRTPADGWNEAWLPVLRARCKEVQGTMNSDSAVPETVRKQMNEYCRQLLAQ